MRSKLGLSMSLERAALDLFVIKRRSEAPRKPLEDEAPVPATLEKAAEPEAEGASAALRVGSVVALCLSLSFNGCIGQLSNDPTTDGDALLGAVSLSAKVASATEVDFSWTIGSIHPSQLVVKRGPSTSSLANLATLSAAAMSDVDSTVTAGNTYYYRIIATTPNGVRYGSQVVSVLTPSASACGDGVCDDSETCTSCSADCGACPDIAIPSGGQACGGAPENSSATITCPAGTVISQITFASYGTPTGSCGSFSPSSCNATTSISLVSGLCLGKASCTVSASNQVFGDPCVGTYKQLDIQATCNGQPAPDMATSLQLDMASPLDLSQSAPDTTPTSCAAGATCVNVSASAGAKGSVSPSGSVSVPYGQDQTFTITPASGYQVSSVLIDGVSYGAVTTYTFYRTYANHTISAAFSPIVSGAACTGSCYVTPTGSGTKNGSDWNNAMSWPSANLVRGTTYYLAGSGTVYAARNLSTPVSGDLYINITKATAANSSKVAGWNSLFGTNQALFDSTLVITTSNWVIDGQTRDESNWFKGPSYGFQFTNLNFTTMILVEAGNSNVTIRYVHFLGGLMTASTPEAGMAIDARGAGAASFDAVTWNTGMIASRNYGEAGYDTFEYALNKDPLIEYNAIWGAQGSATNHGNAIELFWTAYGSTTRYNLLRDSYNGGYPGSLVGGSSSPVSIGWASYLGGKTEVYGNVLDGYGGFAIEACPAGSAWGSGGIGYNELIYNNTIVSRLEDTTYAAISVDWQNTSGNEVFNNVMVSTITNGQGAAGVFTFGNNFGSSDTSAFVNYADSGSDPRDLHLSRSVGNSTPLPPPYNVDMNGTIYTSHSIGAYSY